MKKSTVRYSKSEIGLIRIVEDFLPTPDKYERAKHCGRI
jgi:hypothetical protein